MTFPSVLSRLVGFNDAGGNDHSINIPPGNVGDLLLVVFTADGDPVVTVGAGLNWRKLGQRSNGTSVTGAIFWKIAEGGDFLRLTTSNSQLSTHITFRIAGGKTISGMATDGSSANADPPSHVGHYATNSYLWLVTVHSDGTSRATGLPADFGNLNTSISPAGSSESASTSTAESASVAGSINPGSLPLNVSDQWVAFTLAISAEEPIAHLKGAVSLTAKTAVSVAAGLPANSVCEVIAFANDQDAVSALKASFLRPEHDWRMMNASTYYHRSGMSIHRTDIWALESEPLAAGITFQAEYEDGKLQQFFATYLGCTFYLHDTELLQLLTSKGQTCKSEVGALLADLLNGDLE